MIRKLKLWKTVVLTGAGGVLGTKLFPFLKERYRMRLTDLRQPVWRTPETGFVAADLRSLEQIRAAVRGADGIIHFGAIGGEADWAAHLAVSIDGTFNLYEAARLEGVTRVVYASSVHAVGYYPRSQRIGADVRVRPDSRYGISKCCGEAIASYFADKHGLASLVIRIGNGSKEAPTDERLLSIWISARDLAQLVSIGLDHPDLRFEIVYGASGNSRSFWDNEAAHRLGYSPQDNAERFAKSLLADGPVENLNRIGARYQGGAFVELP